MELGLHGKVALVTGASKGLGRAIALELAREGVELAICARNQAEITQAGREIEDEWGHEVLALAADVTNDEDVRRFVSVAVERRGGIDILVNNAGGATPGDFETVSDAQWRADMEVKLFSHIACTRAVLPHMRVRGGGRIININSVYGKAPNPAFFATSVNRAACLSFSKALATQMAPENILVNSVNIGFVQSPQWESIWRRRAPHLDREEFFAQTAREIPLARFGVPDEVAGLVVFLCSRWASYITGASIDVAGGMGAYL